MLFRHKVTYFFQITDNVIQKSEIIYVFLAIFHGFVSRLHKKKERAIDDVTPWKDVSVWHLTENNKDSVRLRMFFYEPFVPFL